MNIFQEQSHGEKSGGETILFSIYWEYRGNVPSKIARQRLPWIRVLLSIIGLSMSLSEEASTSRPIHAPFYLLESIGTQ